MIKFYIIQINLIFLKLIIYFYLILYICVINKGLNSILKNYLLKLIFI